VRLVWLVPVVLLALPAALLLRSASGPVGGVGEAWVRQLGTREHEAATSVAVGGAGELYLAGWTSGAWPGQTASGGSQDAFVMRYTPSGASWTRQFGTGRRTVASQVAVDGAGNVYVAGQVSGTLATQPAVGEFDAFVRKYTGEGVEVWTRQFGGPGDTGANRLAVDALGHVYVAGWISGALPGQAAAGQADAFVRAYDPAGIETWTRQFGTPGQDRALSVATDGTGAVSVAGLTEDAVGEQRAFVRRFASDGAELSSWLLATAEQEEILDLAVDGAGAVYLVGMLEYGHGDAFVRRYDPDGVEVWTRRLGGAVRGEALELAVDTSGEVYILGPDLGRPVGQAGAGVVGVRRYDADGKLRASGQLEVPGHGVVDSLAPAGPSTVYLAGWTDEPLPGQVSAGLSDTLVARLSL
jgi:hypothetical protein